MQQKRLMIMNMEGRSGMRLLLALALCLVPLAGSQPLVWRILLCAGMLAVYLLALLFWTYFIPNRSQGNMGLLRLVGILLGSAFRRGAAIRRVTGGTFDADYFALRAKPAIPVLAVDAHSAVVIKSGDGKRDILTEGLWALERNTRIVHVFDLRPARLTIGPDTRANPLSVTHHEGSSLRGAKALIASINQTRCQTADGAALVPVIEVIYRITSSDDDPQWTRKIQALSTLLESKNAYGHAAGLIEELFSAQLTGHLKNILGTVQAQDLAGQPDQLAARVQHLAGMDADFLDRQLPAPLRGLFSISIEIKKVWTA